MPIDRHHHHQPPKSQQQTRKIQDLQLPINENDLKTHTLARPSCQNPCFHHRENDPTSHRSSTVLHLSIEQSKPFFIVLFYLAGCSSPRKFRQYRTHGTLIHFNQILGDLSHLFVIIKFIGNVLRFHHKLFIAGN